MAAPFRDDPDGVLKEAYINPSVFEFTNPVVADNFLTNIVASPGDMLHYGLHPLPAAHLAYTRADMLVYNGSAWKSDGSFPGVGPQPCLVAAMQDQHDRPGTLPVKFVFTNVVMVRVVGPRLAPSTRGVAGPG
jgi:hypothetical protein